MKGKRVTKGCSVEDIKLVSKKDLCSLNKRLKSIYPKCPSDGELFYNKEDKNLYVYSCKKWKRICECECDCEVGTINVETANSQTGPALTSVQIMTDGDTLRLWSAGGLSADVQQGSALINIEPNMIFVKEGMSGFMPADTTRPALCFDSLSGGFYIWDPSNNESDKWSEISGGTGTIGEEIEINKITPLNEVVLAENVLLKNPFGIGKIYLNEFLKLDDGETGGIIEPSDWSVEYQTLSGMLLQNNHHFTVPGLTGLSEHIDESTQFYVEVNASVTVMTLFFFATSIESTNHIRFELVKNGEVVNSAALMPVVQDFDDGRIDTLHISDLLLCNQGDTLDLHLIKNVDSEGKVSIGGERMYTRAIFKIMGMANSLP